MSTPEEKETYRYSEFLEKLFRVEGEDVQAIMKSDPVLTAKMVKDLRMDFGSYYRRLRRVARTVGSKIIGMSLIGGKEWNNYLKGQNWLKEQTGTSAVYLLRKGVFWRAYHFATGGGEYSSRGSTAEAQARDRDWFPRR